MKIGLLIMLLWTVDKLEMIYDDIPSITIFIQEINRDDHDEIEPSSSSQDINVAKII